MAIERRPKALVKRLTTEGYGDYDGYPILYLYRHSLELYLKAIVYRGANLLGLLTGDGPTTTKLFQRHELLLLVAPTKAVLSTMRWNLKAAGFDSFGEFQAFIELVDQIDPGSYAFRYPIDRAGNVPDQRPPTINIPAFAQVCDPLLQYLEGAVHAIEDHWQYAAEADYELRQYLSEDA